MKKQFLFLAFAIIMTGLTFTYGEANNKENLSLSDKAIENYLIGLKSDNHGLRLSCAYFLGHHKVNKAVIPLMSMLHNEKTEEARIMAALALTKIGNDLGTYAVKQASVFDKSERVRNLCEKFYNSLNEVNK